MLWVAGVVMTSGKKQVVEENAFCLPKSRLIRAQREGDFVIAEVQPGAVVHLMSTFCTEKANREAKMWIFRNLLTSEKSDVSFEGRFSETAARSLAIHNVSQTDAGIYLCQTPFEDSLELSFNYLLDITDVTSSRIFKEYDAEVWDSTLNAANLALSQTHYSLDPKRLVRLQVVPAWSPWTECEECVSSPTKTRTSYCVITPILVDHSMDQKTTIKDIDPSSKLALEILLETGASLPCRGTLIHQVLPNTFNFTDSIPEFRQSVSCEQSCPILGGKRGPRERRLLLLKEGSNAFVHCPNTVFGDRVRWEHNKRRLESEEFDGMVTVDHFGGLHFLNVKPICKGNYTCFVSHEDHEVRVLEVKLAVIANSDEEWAAFNRHAGYLAIVCALSSFSFIVIFGTVYFRKKKLQSKVIAAKFFGQDMEPLLSTADDESNWSTYEEGIEMEVISSGSITDWGSEETA